jgi:lipopolysaccharide export system permease protein
MILQLYLAQRYFKNFLTVLAIFAVIHMVVDLTEQMRKIALNGGDLGDALTLALLNMPSALYSLFPLVVMLATLVFFLSLARSSELVVVRASGRSALRATMAPIGVAALIGIIGLLVINPIVADTQIAHERKLAQVRGAQERTLAITQEGLWLRQGTRDQQTVINALRANSDGTQLFDVTFYNFDTFGRIEQRIDADEARLGLQSWDLTRTKIWDLTQTNPEASAESFESYAVPSTLTREQILDSFGDPSNISIYALPDFITQLQEAGFAGLSHRVWFQMQLANPLMLMSMVLIGASLTMRHTRFGRTGPLVLAAILLGFGLYFLRSFAQVLGENGQLSAFIVAWTPPLAGSLLALGVILHMEDG